MTTLLCSADSDPYYCIEDYKLIGSLIRDVAVGNSSSAQLLSAGHAARLCSAACDAEPACTAFRSFMDTGEQWGVLVRHLCSNTLLASVLHCC